MRISDIDVEGVREVDDKLVILARQMRCPILTNDYNLNRIAELQGVTILNINELANAVKSVVLPGEMLSVRIIQEGKEVGPGRWLHGRRHDGGGGERARLHRQGDQRAWSPRCCRPRPGG